LREGSRLKLLQKIVSADGTFCPLRALYDAMHGLALSAKMMVARMDQDDGAPLRRGDPQALARIVAAHQQAVLKLCRRYTGSAAAAADIAQDVFVALWDARASYEAKGKLRGYLLGIARHRCLRYLNKHGRFVALAEDTRHSLERTEAHAVAHDLERALAKLSPEHADVLVLRYLEEMSLAEIAAMTGIPEGTVKSRLHRATDALRKVYP
jgi:RNA polymerase sigma-70 factor (ECF subfamily)